MARVQSVAQVPMSTFDGKKDAIVAALQSLQCEITIVTDFAVEAKRGSQVAFRGKGALIANDVDFPIKISVGLFDDNGTPLCNIVVSENMGFGLMVGAKGKYQAVCDRVRDGLATSVQEVN